MLFEYSRVLDVHTIVADDVSSCIFDLCDSGIDFLPAEVMKSYKTTGWLGADYNKVNKVWPHVWRNFDSLVKKKYDNQSKVSLEYTSKMCTTYLKLYNLHIPEKINDKRKAVLEHKKTMF